VPLVIESADARRNLPVMAHRAPSGIADRRAFVVGTEPALDPLARGLRRQGLGVAVCDWPTRYDDAFDAAIQALGQCQIAVWAWTPAALAVPTAVAEVDETAWESMVGSTLRSYVEFLQAAERRLRNLGGRVIVVVPTIAMSGAANLVAWATVAEGQRAMAKSVARVWGARGITVNCVAIPTALLVNATEDLDRPNLQQAALAEPDLADVAAAIATLCSDGFAGVTGTTVGVDGGRWIPS
jgi:NAD(P)-dependent dehydrogenase (short-subunit alcohol dehydrogenase family)